MISAFWHRTKNVGDTLTPVLLNWLGIPFLEAAAKDTGKILGVGSILESAKAGDVVWGSGFLRGVGFPGGKKASAFTRPDNLKVLAARGKLSAAVLNAPITFLGDPALLLPRLYNPNPREIIRRWPLGVIPHYAEADHPTFKALAGKNGLIINTRQNWKTFVDDILSCEKIVSSSLHGIIIAEAYGVPAGWRMVTDKVLGGGFKFHDYYSGTGRAAGNSATGEIVRPIQDLKERQDNLIQVLKEYALTGNQG